MPASRMKGNGNLYLCTLNRCTLESNMRGGMPLRFHLTDHINRAKKSDPGCENASGKLNQKSSGYLQQEQLGDHFFSPPLYMS